MTLPSQTLEVNLRECRTLSRTALYESPVMQYERYDALFGQEGDPAAGLEPREWTRLEYTIRYGDAAHTLTSGEVEMDAETFRARIAEHIAHCGGVITLDLYESEHGELLDHAFDLSFLNGK